MRRCSNSPERSPANTRWVWQSISPGVSQPPLPSIDGGGVPVRQIGGGADPGDPPLRDRERAILDRAVRGVAFGHGREVDVGEQAVPGRHALALGAWVRDRSPRTPPASSRLTEGPVCVASDGEWEMSDEGALGRDGGAAGRIRRSGWHQL